MLAQGHIIAGRYAITRHMRRVGETDYHTAVDRTTDQPVTLRTINTAETGAVGIGLEHLAADKLKRKMENEAQVLTQLGQLHDPGLLPLLDSGFDAPIYYHIYPAFDFYTLQQQIDEQGRIPYPALLKIASQAANTLEALHRIGIIHCDISAETLLLDDHVKIIEFTIANHEEQEGVAPGDPPYMSPESITGAKPAVTRDIWALGVVLYQALTGKLPFGDIEPPREKGVPVLFGKILRETPESLTQQVSDLPPALVSLIDGMLDKDPSRRVGSMAEVKAALAALEPALDD